MPNTDPEIIEAEIVEDASPRPPVNDKDPLRPTVITANARPAWHTPGDHARPYGDRGGMLGGFLVLAMGLLVTVFVLIVSVCIIIPFTLLMRLFGVHKNK